jgi:hypothetical protein
VLTPQFDNCRRWRQPGYFLKTAEHRGAGLRAIFRGDKRRYPDGFRSIGGLKTENFALSFGQSHAALSC